MYGNNKTPNDYWSLTAKQRADLAEYRRERFFYDRLYKDRERGFFSGEAWSAWGRQTEDWLTKEVSNLNRLKLGSPTGEGGLQRAAVGAIVGTVLMPGIGTVLGAAIGGALNVQWSGPTFEEVEAIGAAHRYGPRTRFVDTMAAKTMRQRTLSAMHNSVYALRGALGNEASLMHG